jgi:hypothetical protein
MSKPMKITKQQLHKAMQTISEYVDQQGANNQ